MIVDVDDEIKALKRPTALNPLEVITGHHHNMNNKPLPLSGDGGVGGSVTFSPEQHDEQQSSPIDEKATQIGTPYTIRELFDDLDTTTVGRVRSCFYGLEEIKWWISYSTFTGTTRYTYNLLHDPLGFIGGRSELRLKLIRIVDSPYFDAVSVLLIVLNAITLVFDTPEFQNEESVQYMLSISEKFFLIVFTLEIMIKVSAMGFITFIDSYMWSPWNVMDFLIVCASYVGLHPDVGNVSILRMLRLLRPLRTVSRVVGLRILLDALMNAMTAMTDVFTMILFVGIFFAIIGKELWAGGFDGRCYVWVPQLLYSTLNNVTNTSMKNGSNSSLSLNYMLAQNITRQCGLGIGCTPDTTGITQLSQTCDIGWWRSTIYSFDNLPLGFLHTFTLMTLENWPNSLRIAQDTGGEFVDIFYLFIVVIGAYLCMNLLLATLTKEYTDEWRRQSTAVLLEKKRAARVSTETFYPITPANMFITVIRPVISVYTSTSIPLNADEFKNVREKIEADDSDDKHGKDMVGSTMDESFVEEMVEDINTASPVAGAASNVQPPGSPRAQKKGLIPTLQRHQRLLRKLIAHSYVSAAFLIVAMYNVIVISIDRYDLDQDTSDFINRSNFACNIIFAFELAIKVVALGPRGYMKDNFNIIDGLLVLVSVPDMILTGSSTFSALRALRVCRVFAVARRIKSIHGIVIGVIASLKSVAYLSVFLAMFVFIMAIVGVQLFAVYGELPNRNDFATLSQAFITVFVLITGEQWVAVMQEYIEATNSYAVVVYFLMVTILGNLILVNQFVAILVDSFQFSGEEKANSMDEGPISVLFNYDWYQKLFPSRQLKAVRAQNRMKYLRQKSNFEKIVLVQTPLKTPANEIAMLTFVVPSQSTEVYPPVQNRFTSNEILRNFLQTACVRPFAKGIIVYPKCFAASDLILWLKSEKHCTTMFQAREYCDVNFIRHDLLTCVSRSQANVGILDWILRRGNSFENDNSMWTVKNTFENDLQPYPLLYGKSLGYFAPDNMLRQKLAWIVLHPAFDWIIILLIAISAVMLALDDTSAANDATKQELFTAWNVFCVLVFMLEMIAKVIVFGLLHWDDVPDQHLEIMNVTELSMPYLQSTMNCIDGFVTIIGFIGLFLPDLRVFRCTRTIRLAMRNAGMRTVLQSVFTSMPAMLNLSVVLIMIFLIYAVLGTQFFSGKMYSCSDSSVTMRSQCNGTFIATSIDVFGNTTYYNQTRMWTNRYMHFNHVISSSFVLFAVALGDGWDDHMYAAIDTVDVDIQPRVNATPWAALYFVIFVIFGNFFALNLFVGLLIQKFTQLKQKYEGSALLSVDQRDWIRDYTLLSRIQLRPRPQRPIQFLRRLCFDFCLIETDTVIDWFLVKVGGKRKATSSTDSIDDEFDNIEKTFVIDAVVNLCVVLNVGFMATEHYDATAEQQSLTDTGSIVFLAVYALETTIKLIAWGKYYFVSMWNRFDFGVLVLSAVGAGVGNSAVQTLRVFRVVRLLRVIRQLKGFMHLLTLLLHSLPSFLNITLLLFLVIYIFAVIGMEMCGGAPRDGVGLHEYAHFDDIYHSLMTLFVVGTRESWTSVMVSCANYSSYAQIFFFIYMGFGALIMVNLFTTVVMEIFTQDPPKENSVLFFNQIKVLKYHWSKLDPTASGKITATQLLRLLRSMKRPVGFTVVSFRAELFALRQMNIVIDPKGCVDYVDVVFALARRSLCVSTKEISILHRYVNVPHHPPDSFMLQHWYCVKRIQQLWKWFVMIQRARASSPTKRDHGTILPLPMEKKDDEEADVVFPTSSRFTYVDGQGQETTTSGVRRKVPLIQMLDSNNHVVQNRDDDINPPTSPEIVDVEDAVDALGL